MHWEEYFWLYTDVMAFWSFSLMSISCSEAAVEDLVEEGDGVEVKSVACKAVSQVDVGAKDVGL
jgi:hypothetical protein